MPGPQGAAVIDGSKIQAVNRCDRNCTADKLDERQEQIEQSSQRQAPMEPSPARHQNQWDHTTHLSTFALEQFEIRALRAETDVDGNWSGVRPSAIQKGDVIRLSAGTARWHVSLDGAAAALLKLDDLQGRVGTPGALVRKGMNPESIVSAPIVPMVKAAPLPPTTPADLKLARTVAALLPHTEDDCPDFDPAQASLELVRLTRTTLLVLQPCWRGAYQTGSRVWQVDDRPPHRARRLDLPMPDGSTNDSLVTEGLGAEGTLDLHEAAKGRGIGDCWASRNWTWAGDRLALVSASESDCRLFEAGGLTVELWRTQVK